jgi:tetraacyldisaccharide 4'-kinase
MNPSASQPDHDRTSGGRLRGPVPGVLGLCAAWAYARAVERRNRKYDLATRAEADQHASRTRVRRVPLPVISVGNLSVGGTGKTPMVAHLCSILLEHGLRPAIAMRGYALRKADAGARADEPDLYSRLLPGVPLVVGADRSAGISRLLAQPLDPAVRAIVLDDGFQHRALARDMDIVLIDASRSPFADRLLPAGWLREPVESLKRATHVVIMHAEMATAERIAEIESRVESVHGRPPIAITRHIWTALLDGEAPLPLDWLLGKRVLACCAIGNPEGFLRTLDATLRADAARPGAIVSRIVLRDHARYDQRTVSRIATAAREQRAEAIVVTDKDWSKLRRVPASIWPCPVVRPSLSLSFDRGGEALAAAVLATASRT